jgi:hypothetical protein
VVKSSRQLGVAATFGTAYIREPDVKSTGQRDEMRPQRTFEAISNVLDDGSWHELVELREATHFPVEWVEQLRAEGVVETSDDGESLRVRLTKGAVPH